MLEDGSWSAGAPTGVTSVVAVSCPSTSFCAALERSGGVVTYSGGYDLPDDAPAGLQLAVIEAVRERRASSSEESGGAVQSTVHGDTRVTYFNSSREVSAGSVLPRGVLDLLGPYKRFALA